MEYWSRLGTLICLSITASFLLSSCALTPPSSEALIFDDGEKEKSRSSHIFEQPQYQTDSGEWRLPHFYLSATVSPRGDIELNYAKDKFSSFINETLSNDSTLTESNLIIRNANYLSVGAPISLIKQDKLRLALNIGFPVLGMDATTPLFGQTYLTANLGYGDGEVLIQHKITQTENGGLALGGFYRAERRGFEITDDKSSLFVLGPIQDALSADRIFYNHIIGPRIYGYVHPGASSILLRAAPGYALNLKKPILNISLSISFN